MEPPPPIFCSQRRGFTNSTYRLFIHRNGHIYGFSVLSSTVGPPVNTRDPVPDVIEDIEFLSRSNHRVAALRALRQTPRNRDELQVATGASKATIARLLNEFEDRNWVGRDGNEYELTGAGRFVADEFLRLVDRMETERTLRDVWRWFPTHLPGCNMSMFVGAVITFPESHSPYHPLPRFVELVESAGTMRAFSKRSPKPGSYEVILQNAADGMEIEFVLPRAVIAEMVDVIDENVLQAAVDSSNLSIFEHDRLPTDVGVGLFDARLALYCRDENGVTKVGVDTDNPEAVDWGASLIEDVRDEAVPIDLEEIVE